MRVILTVAYAISLIGASTAEPEPHAELNSDETNQADADSNDLTLVNYGDEGYLEFFRNTLFSGLDTVKFVYDNPGPAAEKAMINFRRLVNDYAVSLVSYIFGLRSAQNEDGAAETFSNLEIELIDYIENTQLESDHATQNPADDEGISIVDPLDPSTLVTIVDNNLSHILKLQALARGNAARKNVATMEDNKDAEEPVEESQDGEADGSVVLAPVADATTPVDHPETLGAGNSETHESGPEANDEPVSEIKPSKGSQPKPESPKGSQPKPESPKGSQPKPESPKGTQLKTGSTDVEKNDNKWSGNKLAVIFVSVVLVVGSVLSFMYFKQPAVV